jgi:hypothetical protein
MYKLGVSTHVCTYIVTRGAKIGALNIPAKHIGTFTHNIVKLTYIIERLQYLNYLLKDFLWRMKEIHTYGVIEEVFRSGACM